MKYPIVPAIIPTCRQEIIQFAETVSFANEIQIDVVDGQFVENISWPYEPTGEPKTIRHATDRFTLEVDLMVAKPIVAAESWIAAGADMLVFHIESVPLEAFKKFAEQSPVSTGVACHGDTKIETLLSYAAFADYVQLMGIKEIGKQGEPFHEQVLESIALIKHNAPSKMISVDGSVNEDTIIKLKEAGAHRFVSGSTILKSKDPEIAYKKLKKLVE